MHDQPSTSNQGNIHIHAPVTAGGSVINGHGNVTNISQNASLAPDNVALKASLQDLFGALSNSKLPMQTQIETQTATGQADQLTNDPTYQVEAVAQHLQQAGQSLQRAKVAVEEGSQLATSVIKLAHLLGPAVGGARVVAGWFGIHLP